MKISSNVVEDSNDENDFLYKLLLTNTKVSKLRKAFANGSSAKIKLLKIQLDEIGQSRGFLGINYLIAPIKGLLSVLKFIDNEFKNVLKNKNKISGTIKTVDSSIKDIKKIFRVGITVTGNEIKDLMKVIKSLENTEVFLKGTTRKILVKKKDF